MRKIVFFLILLSSQGLAAQSNDDCMMCHEDDTLTKTVNGKEVSMYVDMDVYETSVHADMLECIDCHMDIDEIPHAEDLETVECSMCHDDAAEEYEESVHAIALRGGSQLTATCADCHGTHDILSSDDVGSHVNQQNLSETCGHCHSKKEVIQLFNYRGMDPVAYYENSVHGKKLSEDPSAQVATCVACHGSHRILPPTHPQSTFSKFALPDICGECHAEETERYKESIHWRGIQMGHEESPVCNDCHGEHRIASPGDVLSITHPSLVSTELCAKCHSNEVLMDRHGLDAERFTSYMKTYHGLAVLKGSPDAANCTSCHEVHAIRSAMDSLSAVHPNNVQKTCESCHSQSIAARFSEIEVHPTNQKERNPIAYYVKQIYIWLIVLAVAGMLLHNGVIHSFYFRKKREKEKNHEMVRRFQPFEVYQHSLLFLSFAVLVVTGFALKFPEMQWAILLENLGLNEPVRSSLHRIAGVVMIIISTIQLAYLIGHKKGRRDLAALRPGPRDLGDFFRNMRYYLRLSSEKPQFGRFDYTEKFEYLDSLIWGTIVMAATGLILWFPGKVMAVLPPWIFEVSEMIHYYEAWLATLAILIWHWYFVIFHPEKYPVSTAFIHGKITKEEQEHHHPLENKEESTE